MRAHSQALITFLLLSTTLAGAVPVYAQELPVVPFTIEKCISSFNQSIAGEATRVRESKLPLGVSDVAPAETTAVALIASDKDGRGFISFSRDSQSSTGMADNLTLKISSPFNKDENQAVFASLGGLSGDVIASGAFSRFIWDLSPMEYGRKICQACSDAGIKDLLDCNQQSLSEALKAKGIPDSDISKKTDELQAALFGTTVGKLWGMEASLGRQERTFFEADAKKVKDDRAGYSFAAVGGMVFRQWSAYGRLTGKRDYQENDKATFCTSITGSVLENCTSQPFGRAKQVESLILAAEARYFLKSVAFAPSAHYDFKSEVWRLEVPVFLLRDSDGGFTGGFKLAWQSDQRDLVAAIFVTKALQP
jgi:hypothetical protein